MIVARSDAFDRAVKEILLLHREIRAGRDESAVAEECRDRLDILLGQLQPAEYERARWLSEDLYSLAESGSGDADSTNRREDAPLREIKSTLEAKEWDKALGLVRSSNGSLSASDASALRGEAWLKAGQYEVAAAFYEYALGLARDDTGVQLGLLLALMRFDSNAAARLAEELSG